MDNIKIKSLKQFWTPFEIADFIVSYAKKYIDNTTNKELTGCDPACGDGIFLKALKKHGFKVFGVDIDSSVIEFIDNELKQFVKIGNGLNLEEENKFDIVVGNPPFSSKYGRIKGLELKKFELGKGRKSQAIEILFLEKFIKLCSYNGVIGIILPHGIFSALNLSYVRDYIRKHIEIIAIFSLPRNIFRNGKTSSKTCILIGKKTNSLNKRKVLFVQIQNLEEFKNKNFSKFTYDFPEEFLYPEFYLDRNVILGSFPKLKDFNIIIKQGRTNYGKKRKFFENGIPFISAKVITNFGIDFSRDRKFIKENSSMDYKNAYVEIGDLVFVRVGVGCIGKCAVITSENEKGIADDWIYIIRVKDKRLSPYYLCFWFQTSLIQKEIRRLARGVGTITIPISLIKEIPITIPLENELNYYKEMYLEMNKEFKKGNLIKAKEIREMVLNKLEQFCSTYKVKKYK